MEDIFTILNQGEIVIGLIALSTIKYYALYKVGTNPTLERHHVGNVSKLFIYPLKTCEGVEVSHISAEYDTARAGQLRDRHMIITTKDFKALSRRDEPQLVKIRVKWTENEMFLEAKGTLHDLKIPFNVSSDNTISTKVIGQEVQGLDCGEEASEWLHKVTGKGGYRLLYSSPSVAKRKVNLGPSVYHKRAADKDMAAFQNMTSLSLISEESIDSANQRIPIDVDNRRLRMNIIVKNCEAFDEDTWSIVKIGSCVLRRLKNCNRCPQTTVDPDTGDRHKQEEPLKTLKQFRMLPGYPTPCMGTCLVVETPGDISAGDDIYAIRG